MTLREDLADWRDWDVAAHAYGLALGVFDTSSQRQIKQVVLSENALGRGLHAGVMALVDAGVLERRDEPEEQYRWAYVETPTAEPGSSETLPLALSLPDLAPSGQPAERVSEPVTASRTWWKRGRG